MYKQSTNVFAVWIFYLFNFSWDCRSNKLGSMITHIFWEEEYQRRDMVRKERAWISIYHVDRQYLDIYIWIPAMASAHCWSNPLKKIDLAITVVSNPHPVRNPAHSNATSNGITVKERFYLSFDQIISDIYNSIGGETFMKGYMKLQRPNCIVLQRKKAGIRL